MAEHPRVFISYARSDGEAFATRLRKRLEKSHPEITLWQDRARMEGGVGWWNQITEALDHVRFLVQVITPAAITSPVVQKEWRYARQQGVCIYPVKGVPDSKLDYKALPKWMSKAHFYDLTKEWTTLIIHLKDDRRAPRVPFMAPDLPAGFIERPEEFGRLRELLIDGDRKDPVAIATALHGGGGFGKTTLAAALCHDEDVITAFDDGILWVTLGESPDVLTGLAKLHTALTGEDPGFRDVEQAAQRLADRLTDRTCLIVLDDVWKPEHLAPFLRGGKACARLITTRQFEITLEARCRRVDVDQMTTAQAVRLLISRLEPPPEDLEPFRALAERLGEWPLLLDLVGAAVQVRTALGDSLAGALAHVNRGLDQRGVTAFDRADEAQRRRSVARTIDVSLDLLPPGDARRYLELAVFPKDVDIPLAVLMALWGLGSFETEDLAQRLGVRSLLKYDLRVGTVRLHNVFRKYLVERSGDLAPTHARLVDAWGDPHHLPDAYAWRWLAYHLVGANRVERLRELLWDFAWLRAKLEATDPNALLADFEPLADDADLRLVQGAIQLSAHVLARDKSQLRSQLFGRLLPCDTPAIRHLRAQAVLTDANPWLRALAPCLTPPGGALLRTLVGHAGWVTAVAIGPDGRQALSGAAEGTLRLWDLQTGQSLRTLEGHVGSVTAVAVLPDGLRALSASRDRTLRLWDLQTGQTLCTLEGHTDWVLAVSVLPDGWHALSAADDGTLRLWDLQTGQAMRRLEGHVGGINAVAVLPDGRQALSAASDGTLRLWDLQTGQALRRLEGHAHRVNAVAVLPDSRYALSASDDRTLRVWDLQTGRALRTLMGHAGLVTAVAVLPDGRQALSAASDGTLRLWDLQTGQALRTLEGHADWVRAVAALPDGRRVLSASDDRTLRLWDLQSSQSLRTVEGHAGLVTAVAVLPDGRQALSAASDGTLRLWDMRTGQSLRTLEGHASGVTSVVILPDGLHALSAATDGPLQLWDLQTGQVLRTLEGHSSEVTSIVVLPDGRHVLSASSDNTLKLWDLSTGRIVSSFQGDAAFWSCGVAQDGVTFLSGDAGGRVYFLRLEGV
jgi:WD40 repeat protein